MHHQLSLRRQKGTLGDKKYLHTKYFGQIFMVCLPRAPLRAASVPTS